MILRRTFILSLILTAACGEIPKDPDGTLDRVRAERQFKVGVIASDTPAGADRQRLFIQRVATAAGAKPIVEEDAAEPLLVKLEEGEVDVLVGELVPTTPWTTRVTLLPPLGEQVSADGHVHVVAAAKNGENAWISLLHKEAQKVAAIP